MFSFWIGIENGALTVRFELVANVSFVYLVSLVREADLMSRWNPVCTGAGITTAVSPLEFIGYSECTFRIIPLPPSFTTLHAVVSMPRCGHVAILATPAAAHELDRTALPDSVRKRGELKTTANVTFAPETAEEAASDAPRTRVKGVLTAEVASLGPRVMALLRSRTLVGLILTLVVPMIWNAFQHIMKTVASPDSPWAARVVADETGLYRRVREASRQVDR